MFQTFHWMQNTRQRTLQQAQPHCRTGTHKRKALFSLSPPNKIVWEAYPMVKSPGKYHNIRTKRASAHNQTWSPSDARLTGGARVGFGAYVQSPTSNNTTHKLSIQKWAQGAADELCLTAPGLCRQLQWQGSTGTLTHLTHEIPTAAQGPALGKGGMGSTQLISAGTEPLLRGAESWARAGCCSGGTGWPAELSVCHCSSSNQSWSTKPQPENVSIVQTLPGFSFNFVPFLED